MKSKNILFLTWKDIKHPNKWGAEAVIHEYAKWLVNKWHNVVWFASWFDWCIEEELIDGIQIIRKFNINTIYFKAHNWYKEYKKNHKIDIIIDEAWGIPLLSPLYEKNIPIIFMIHHIWEKEWDFKFKFPINIIFKFIFWMILKLYKNKNTITVSKSTKDELITKYWFKEDNIKIIENRLNLQPLEFINFDKKENSILFLWRLTQIKRVEDAIYWFNEFQKINKNYELNILWIEQEKEYVESLKDIVNSLNLNNKVFFKWFSKDLFFEYLQKSKILLVPSYKEWFWLVVIEWNAYWLPAIWYNVPGLIDSIQDWINGFKTTSWDFENIWTLLENVLNNDENYIKLANSSLETAKSYYWWDSSINELEKYIINLIK